MDDQSFLIKEATNRVYRVCTGFDMTYLVGAPNAKKAEKLVKDSDSFLSCYPRRISVEIVRRGALTNVYGIIDSWERS